MDVALAVDVGGTKVEAALIDVDGRIVPGSPTRGSTGPSATRDELAESIDAVIEGALARSGGFRLIGAGVGSAGPVDLGRGTISPNNLPRLAGYPIRDRVGEFLDGLPVTLRLDGTCIALAEWWLGATSGASNSMSMIVSTGVGGGLIVQDHLIAGHSGNAGHVGQIQIATGGPGDSPHAGTVEMLASGPRTVAWAREQGWRGHTGEDLAASYATSDPIARRAVRRSATAVGQAIASVTTLLDLEVVAIGGGFVNVAADYVEHVSESVLDSAVFDYARRVSVVPTGLGGSGPILGAAALVHCAHLLEPVASTRREPEPLPAG